jgi:hypothetical protein
VLKCHTLPGQQRRQLGLDVDFADGKFRVPVDRQEALREVAEGLVGARHGRVQARMLASLTGTVLSIHLSWGPVTQLYTRHLYALINSMRSLNRWVTLTEGAMSELLFWQGLPRIRFVGEIWPPTAEISIWMESDANNFGWGGHTTEDAPQYPGNMSRRRRAPSLQRTGSCSECSGACRLCFTCVRASLWCFRLTRRTRWGL